jgi:hypothetical protein
MSDGSLIVIIRNVLTNQVGNVVGAEAEVFSQ